MPGQESADGAPYYQGDIVTVYAGDCLDVMATMSDASVDSVVCDPPYSIGFMGRTWDAHDNLKQFEAWCRAWATECLRVLKPGGHLVAFGGTRTYHRLTCGIEDAGFEIRDSIGYGQGHTMAWMYGSGFPKSLDVSKAIDKQRAEDRAPIDGVRAWLNNQRISAGFSLDAVNKHFGHASNGGGSAASWMTNPSSKSLPSWEQWQELKRLFDFGDELDAEVQRLNRRKGKPGDAWGERPDAEYRGRPGMAQSWTDGTGWTGASSKGGDGVTDAAKQWEGWGTALKPSHEPVVFAVKPYGLQGILDAIGSQLDRLESECRPPAKRAASSSAPTRRDSHAVRAVSALASAVTPPADGGAQLTETGRAADSSAPTATSASESTAATYSSTVTSWRRCWAELCELTSTYTTATNASLTTDLKTLNSCLSRITLENTPTVPTGPGEFRSIVSAADNLFGATVLSSRSTRALSAIESATNETLTEHQDAAAQDRPRWEPIVLARKPLDGTVAHNVTTFGTGALNIDGCRIDTADNLSRPQTPNMGGAFRFGGFSTRAELESAVAAGARCPNGRDARLTLERLDRQVTPEAAIGRWPPNVVLDEAAAAVLDQQSGNRPGFSTQRDVTQNDGAAVVAYGAGLNRIEPGVRFGRGDSGGASRFFPVFKYTAKAPSRERPEVDGIRHPTVKPLEVMRWLVRLVTPPGGVCLDPFAGSGTTAEAAVLEGMRCIAVEREPTYLPLIVARLSKPMVVGFDFEASGQ